MPWDLFGLLSVTCKHREKRHHHRVHRSMRVCVVEDVVNDDGNDDGSDDNQGQVPKTTCACTDAGKSNVRVH